jgi:uncharacterized membrane protein
MKKKSIIILQLAISLLPLIYLLLLWSHLPEKVPVHFNGKFVADSYGSRSELLYTLLFIGAVAMGTSLLVNNINKIDPKSKYSENTIMRKISWALVIFLMLIGSGIIYISAHYSDGNMEALAQKYLLAVFALLIVVLGNLMNNIKPNYFVGIRTPWGLEDEDNWRRTHHLGSKLWFFGGLTMLLLILLLPPANSSYVLLIGLFPLVVIPVWYSYNIFRQKRNEAKRDVK